MKILINDEPLVVNFYNQTIVVQLASWTSAWRLRHQPLTLSSPWRDLLVRAGQRVVIRIRDRKEFEWLPEPSWPIRLASRLSGIG